MGHCQIQQPSNFGAKSPLAEKFQGTARGTYPCLFYDSLYNAMDKSECFYDGSEPSTKRPMDTANKRKILVWRIEDIKSSCDLHPFVVSYSSFVRCCSYVHALQRIFHEKDLESFVVRIEPNDSRLKNFHYTAHSMQKRVLSLELTLTGP
ncbi:uncharacterized protein RAG0_01618 [Rhynchosporium agropyri]|uniref:Uncharacterized protein n=1 Tax=Rhynchosporium agropyri TaxID=914238 RepID=A0A1E1JXP9_9HELO|nr:uncharacterized protein RAG0_01618 [Rhynchosporium agropyri]